MAAAVVPSSGGSAAPTSRFTTACGALSQYLKAAEAERAAHARAAAPLPLLPLMPGADIDDGQQDDLAAEAPTPAQMTIVYGARVLVLDDVQAAKAAGLLRLAAATAAEVVSAAAADLPVARKASLQRFMEKRRVRVAAARAEPYRRPDACPDHLKLAL